MSDPVKDALWRIDLALHVLSYMTGAMTGALFTIAAMVGKRK